MANFLLLSVTFASDVTFRHGNNPVKTWEDHGKSTGKGQEEHGKKAGRHENGCIFRRFPGQSKEELIGELAITRRYFEAIAAYAPFVSAYQAVAGSYLLACMYRLKR